MWTRKNHDVSVRFQLLKIIYHTISLFISGWIFRRFVTHMIMRNNTKWNFLSLEGLKFSLFCYLPSIIIFQKKVLTYKSEHHIIILLMSWGNQTNKCLLISIVVIKPQILQDGEMYHFIELNFSSIWEFWNVEYISTYVRTLRIDVFTCLPYVFTYVGEYCSSGRSLVYVKYIRT